jgi:hypothetical protein
VHGNTTIYGGGNVLADLQVGGGGHGDLQVHGNTTIYGGANVLGDFQVEGRILAGVQSVVGDGIAVEGGGSNTAGVACPSGTTAISGGFDITQGGQPIVLASRPTATGWETVVQNGAGAPTVTVRAWAICSRLQ